MGIEELLVNGVQKVLLADTRGIVYMAAADRGLHGITDCIVDAGRALSLHARLVRSCLAAHEESR